jgi:hypothetical protein
MKVEEVKMYRLRLCRPDIESLTKGDVLRFTVNGSLFELSADAAPRQRTVEEKPEEKPSIKEKLGPKPKPGTPRAEPPREDKPQGVKIIDKGDKFIIRGRRWRRGIRKTEYAEIKASLKNLPVTFKSAQLRAANKNFSDQKIRAGLHILLYEGLIERVGPLSQGHYRQPDTKQAKAEEKPEDSLPDEEEAVAGPIVPSEGEIIEALEQLVRKGEVWEDALTRGERSIYHALESQGLAIRRVVGYEGQACFCPTTRGFEHLKKLLGGG